MFWSLIFSVMALQHNRLTLRTNHNIACSKFTAYRIYVRVFLALSPKVAPIPKTRFEKGLEPPLFKNTASIIYYSTFTILML
jgi:hypothetical protein